MKRLIIIAVIIVAGYQTLFSQLFIASDAVFHTDTQAVVNVLGTLDNAGTIDNAGEIRLSGNFINTTPHTLTGTLRLTGGFQTLYHQGKDMENLIIEGGDTKELYTDITIQKQLSLNTGIVFPNKSILRMGKQSSVTDGNQASFVNGSLYWEVTGNSLYFPIGKKDLFAPAELHNIKASGDAVVGIELHYPNNTTFEFGKSVTQIIHSRYYQMNVAQGTYTASNISLPYFKEDNPLFFTQDQITILQSDDLKAEFNWIGNMENKSRLSTLNLLYMTSYKSATMKYYTLGTRMLADMSLLYIPNALSHNAPDENDRVVKVYGKVFREENFSFVVSNQWGNKVFESKDVKEMESKGWDGTNRRTGRKEVTGQYHYVIHAETLDGREYDKAGSIWILD